jgi:hypothetical protein
LGNAYVFTVIEELGKSVGDSNIEAKDETLLTLAELSRRASDPCTLPTSNFSRTKSPVESVALRANISETGLVLLINEQKGEKEEIRDERESSQFGNHLERALWETALFLDAPSPAP